MMTPLQQLMKWYRREYDHRTAKVCIGIAPINWIDKGTRVSWSEVYSKARELGIESDPVTLRLDFDAALQRRKKGIA